MNSIHENNCLQSEKIEIAINTINSTQNREEIIEAFFEQLHTIIEYESSSLQVIEGDDRLLIGYRGHLSGNFSYNLHRNISKDSLIDKIVSNKKPLVIGNTNESKLWEHLDGTTHVQSWIGVPLIFKEQVIGLLTIDHTTPNYYIQEFGEAIFAFINKITPKLITTKWFQQIHQAQALAELSKLSQQLILIEPSIDSQTLLENVAKSAKDVLDADLIELYEYKEEQKDFQLPQISIGIRRGNVVKKEKIYEDDIIHQLIEDPAPQYFENAQTLLSPPYTIERTERPDERFVIREAIQSVAIVPLKTKDEKIGLMFVNYRTPQRFAKKQQELIGLFANQAAIVIKNSRITQRLNLQNKRQDTLIKLGQRLTSDIRTEEQIFQLIYENTSELMDMKNGYIALYDELSKKIHFKFAFENRELQNVSNHEKWKKHRKPDEGGRTEYIINQRESLLFRTESEAEAWYKKPGHHKHETTNIKNEKSWLGVPMISSDKVLGVIAIHQEKEYAYNEDDKNILIAIANYAAISIDKAHSYEELSKERNVLHSFIDMPTPDKIYIKDISSRFIIANKTILDSMNVRTLEELKGKTDFDFHEHALAQQYYDEEQEIFKTGMSVLNREELKRDRITGEPTWWLINKVPFCDSSEKIVGLVGINRNITSLKKIQQRQEALIKLAQELTSIIQEQELTYMIHEEIEKNVLQLLYQKASGLMDTKNMYVALYDEKSEAVRFPLAYKDSQPLMIETRKAGQGKTEEIIRNKKPILHKTQHEANEWYAQPQRTEYTGHISPSWMGVPLFIGNKVIGVIATYHNEKEHVYSDDDLAIFQTMANLTAIAFENIRLYVKVYQKQEILIELSQKLTSNIHLTDEQIVSLIYRNASKLMDTQNMYIALYDEASDIVRFPLAYKNGSPISVKTRKSGLGRTEAIIKEKKPIFILTREESIEWYSKIGHKEYIDDPLASWIGVPMLIGDKVLGVVATYDPIRDYVYNKDDLNMLQSMGNIAAIAINNIQLVKEREDLLKFQQDAELGSLTSSLAHRIGNKGGMIRLKMDALKKYLSEKSPKDEVINQIIEVIERNNQYMLELSGKILKPFSASKSRMAFSNITLLINDALHSATIPKTVVVEKHYAPDLPPVKVNRYFVEVFYELISNALEAMRNSSEQRLTICAVHDSDWLKVSFSDTGEGVADLENLFKLFKTREYNSDNQEHFGLGLWGIKRFLNNHNADITAENLEVGARFTILLPLEKKS